MMTMCWQPTIQLTLTDFYIPDNSWDYRANAKEFFYQDSDKDVPFEQG